MLYLWGWATRLGRARELLRAVKPMAIEATQQADQSFMPAQADQRRICELDLQQARYEASLAERRCAACDPDNRPIAAQLEKNCDTALQRVRTCEELTPTWHAPSAIRPDSVSPPNENRRGVTTPVGLSFF